MTNSYNVLLHKMEASYSELHAEGKKPYSLYEPIVYTLSSGEASASSLGTDGRLPL